MLASHFAHVTWRNLLYALESVEGRNPNQFHPYMVHRAFAFFEIYVFHFR